MRGVVHFVIALKETNLRWMEKLRKPWEKAGTEKLKKIPFIVYTEFALHDED